MVGTGVSSEGFIKALSDAYGGAIFLATRGVGADPATTLHVTGPGDAKRLTKACEHLVGGKITIRRHAPELLAKPHSMQSLVGVLVGEETIIADPTGAVTRAVQLVDMARRARAFMPKRVRGLYFNPARGVVFGWMREPPPAEEARSAMESAMAEAGAEWACVILSPVLPAVGLVAVDEVSAKAVAAQRARARLARLVTTVAAAVGLSGAIATVATADIAPSDPLFQAVFKGGGGTQHDKSFGSLDGSAGFYGPVYGQIDGKGYTATGANGGGAALQFGLRDPALYRAGVFIAGGSAGPNFTMGGAKGDLFAEQFSLHLLAGELAVAHGPHKSFVGGGGDLYLGDDTKLFINAIGAGSDTFGSGGIEHTFQSLAGLTFGGAGTFGPDQDGFKIYAKWWFGAPGGSLKHEDRYGPADSVLDDGWFGEVRRLGKHATYGGSVTPPPT